MVFLWVQKCNHRGLELQLIIQNVSMAHETVSTCLLGGCQTFQSADDCMVDVCENAQLQIQDFAKGAQHEQVGYLQFGSRAC